VATHSTSIEKYGGGLSFFLELLEPPLLLLLLALVLVLVLVLVPVLVLESEASVLLLACFVMVSDQRMKICVLQIHMT